MKFRFQLVLLSLVAAMSLGSCTTRYQNLLRDRDTQIRELNGRIASLTAENEDLNRRIVEERSKPAPQVQAQPAAFGSQQALQDELGADANVSYRDGRLRIGVEDKVTFDSGSDKLKSSANQVLNKVAQVLSRDFSDCRFYIEGHTDSDPIRKTKDKFSSNRHLSVMRADAVARYLMQQGVSEDRIVVVGYGQFDPVDKRVKEKNRRVEIVPVRE